MSSSVSEIDQLLQSLGFSSGSSSLDTGRNDGMGAMAEDFPTSEATEMEEESVPSWRGLLRPLPESPEAPHVVQRPEAELQRMLVQSGKFFPIAPDTLASAGLHCTEVSDLILKYMALRGAESGFNIARQLGL